MSMQVKLNEAGNSGVQIRSKIDDKVKMWKPGPHVIWARLTGCSLMRPVRRHDEGF